MIICHQPNQHNYTIIRAISPNVCGCPRTGRCPGACLAQGPFLLLISLCCAGYCTLALCEVQ